VPVISIDGRVKRLYSIWLKLKAQKIDLEQVYDFVALRIVTPSVKDCYAALGIIHQTWSPVPGRIKDFIAMPRPNGYQSLHTSVISDRGFPFEVQIPHRGDASARRGRHCGALEVQGRPRRRRA
jgi:GTP pyrophosphokinase